MRVPLGTSDFSSYLLQAQNSGAQVLGLANAGGDFTNSLKAANEFGITKTMKPAALLAFISDIHALGLETAKGLYLTTGWYWDLNDKTRAFAKRFFEKIGRRADDDPGRLLFGDAHLSQRGQGRRHDRLRQGDGGTAQDEDQRHVHRQRVIRADGLMEHEMYVMQVKKPSESKYPWDYYRLVETMTGEQAFGKLADSACPLVKK